MELQITKLYKDRHNEIVGFEWKNPDDNTVGRSLISDFVEWVEKRGGKAYISSNADDKAYLSVRILPNGDRTLQPSRNGVWSSELNALQALAV